MSSSNNKRKAANATEVANDLLSVAAAMRRKGVRDHVMQHLTAEQVAAMASEIAELKKILAEVPEATDEPKPKQPKLGANITPVRRCEKMVHQVSSAPACMLSHVALAARTPHPSTCADVHSQNNPVRRP